MLIKIWQLIILYIDRMDWRAGHLTTTEGTGGGAFSNKNCPQGRASEKKLFKCPRVCPRGAGRMLSAGIDSHITPHGTYGRVDIDCQNSENAPPHMYVVKHCQNPHPTGQNVYSIGFLGTTMSQGDVGLRLTSVKLVIQSVSVTILGKNGI